MDKLMRAMVSIPRDTNVPEDVTVNVWHFDGDDIADATNADYHNAVMSLLTAFYQAVDGVIFSSFIGSPATVKIYDLREPEPRTPEFTGSIALTPTVNATVPAEVAICLSFKAEYESGIPQARRRGRVYLGPVSTSAFTNDVGDVVVPSAVRTSIRDAANTMMAGQQVAAFAGSVKWSVYSPTTDLSESIDASFNDVVGGWVDDRVDIIRRRGRKSTVRTTFGV